MYDMIIRPYRHPIPNNHWAKLSIIEFLQISANSVDWYIGMCDVEHTGTFLQATAELISLSCAETGVPRKK